MIRVGQVLKIPAPESLAVKPEVAEPTTDPVTAAAKQAFLAAKTDIAKPEALITKTDHRETACSRREDGHRETACSRR